MALSCLNQVLAFIHRISISNYAIKFDHRHVNDPYRWHFALNKSVQNIDMMAGYPF